MLVIVLLVCTAIPNDVFAQIAAPSQVTPQSLRPAAPQSSPSIALTSQGSLVAPAGSENLFVVVGDVALDGQFPELAAATAPYLHALRGKRLSVAEIYSAAAAIEKIYTSAGFVLARVSVPQQQLIDNGRLVIVVTDGFIEEVDVRALPDEVRRVVAERTNFMLGRRHVLISEIERCLLIAGDTPGLKLKSTLMRGQGDVGAKLVLDGYFDMLVGSLGGDNRQPASLGTWQMRGSAVINSAFGYGEQIYGSVGSSVQLENAIEGTAPLRVFGGGAVVPLGADGFTVNPEFTHSVTQTKAQPGVPSSVGTFDRLALRMKNPLIWTRLESLNTTGAIEYIRQNLFAPEFGSNLYADEYAALRLGANYSTTFKSGTGAQIGGNFSQGLGGRGSRDILMSGVPLSRLGASSEFSKFNANARLTQPFADIVRLDVIAIGQFSMNKAMMRSEQLSLDGPEAVSAFSAGTLNADQGATLRAEISRSIATRFDRYDGTLSPYVFASAGRGWLANATAVEQAIINAGALGVGLRTSIDEKATFTNFTLGIEFARQFSDIQGAERGWRGNVNAAVTF
ncbi:MAG: ShlB/FhaC/HecB family hemolysin secretion/activation protein [Afipia sp.]|nr:ShlB/FhaC/HecB family hemolysin secretion/activation protein [Afipia sp.]